MIDFILHTDRVITVLVATHSNEVYGVIGLLLFLECGVVLLPFLPGDSLLFFVGALCAKHLLLIKGVLIVGSIGAALGNMMNYATGDRVRRRGELHHFRFVQKETMVKAETFFRKYGTLSIIFARFLPFFRTFVPFVAGFLQMPPRPYVITSIASAVLWVGSMACFGYVAGDLPFVRENITLLTGAVAMLSVTPIAVGIYRLQRRSVAPHTSASRTDQSSP